MVYSTDNQVITAKTFGLQKWVMVTTARWMLVAFIVAVVAFGMVTVVSGDGAMEVTQLDEDLEVDPDRVLLRASIQADGTGEWLVSYRMHLDTDEEVEAFDELLAEIEADPESFTERFRERMEPTVEGAAAATDRDMEMGEVTVRAERRFVDREYGIIEYRFNWTNFAAVDGDELHAGDAISGMFLTEETSLVFDWPDSHELVEVSPSPDATDDRSVRWGGPRDFTANEPRLVVSSAPDAEGISLWMLAIIALAVMVGIGGAGYYLVRGPSQSSGESTQVTPETEPEEDLLSNEERVLRLVRENEGRMKQQAIANELGWTDAKTSKVVRTLREEGELEGFRLGRENVLRLPEVAEEE